MPSVERGDGERGEDGEEPGTNGGLNPDGGELLELAIVVASVLLIVATLGYVGWQAAVTTADGVPTATRRDRSSRCRPRTTTVAR